MAHGKDAVYWDKRYREVEAARPRLHRYRSYNDYCRAMDIWTREFISVLEADAKDLRQDRAPYG